MLPAVSLFKLTQVMFAPYPCVLGPVPKLPCMRSNLSPAMTSLKTVQPCPVTDGRETFQSNIRKSVAFNPGLADVGYQLPAPIWPAESCCSFDEFHSCR